MPYTIKQYLEKVRANFKSKGFTWGNERVEITLDIKKELAEYGSSILDIDECYYIVNLNGEIWGDTAVKMTGEIICYVYKLAPFYLMTFALTTIVNNEEIESFSDIPYSDEQDRVGKRICNLLHRHGYTKLYNGVENKHVIIYPEYVTFGGSEYFGSQYTISELLENVWTSDDLVWRKKQAPFQVDTPVFSLAEEIRVLAKAGESKRLLHQLRNDELIYTDKLNTIAKKYNGQGAKKKDAFFYWNIYDRIVKHGKLQLEHKLIVCISRYIKAYTILVMSKINITNGEYGDQEIYSLGTYLESSSGSNQVEAFLAIENVMNTLGYKRLNSYEFTYLVEVDKSKTNLAYDVGLENIICDDNCIYRELSSLLFEFVLSSQSEKDKKYLFELC
ncbi:hypothetical protein [uncultured Veillonella sp.]|uniref:hypothetical protein n=1 Tax=uncultured Veillonella sp. TaxID=159268 RepID=UPI0025979340|nr:hypothetical protein [uncultured Veillonella sp.]